MLVRYYLKLEITWLRYYLKHQNKTIKVFPYQIWVKEDFSICLDCTSGQNWSNPAYSKYWNLWGESPYSRRSNCCCFYKKKCKNYLIFLFIAIVGLLWVLKFVPNHGKRETKRRALLILRGGKKLKSNEVFHYNGPLWVIIQF